MNLESAQVWILSPMYIAGKSVANYDIIYIMQKEVTVIVIYILESRVVLQSYTCLEKQPNVLASSN